MLLDFFQLISPTKANYESASPLRRAAVKYRRACHITALHAWRCVVQHMRLVEECPCQWAIGLSLLYPRGK